MNCVTHHYACDCREAEHAKEIEALRAGLLGAIEALKIIKKSFCPIVENAEYAEGMFLIKLTSDAYFKAKELLAAIDASGLLKKEKQK